MYKLPEESNCVETCRSKLIVKYVIYRVVHLLVLIEFVNHFTMHGRNNMKVSECFLPGSTRTNTWNVHI